MESTVKEVLLQNVNIFRYLCKLFPRWSFFKCFIYLHRHNIKKKTVKKINLTVDTWQSYLFMEKIVGKQSSQNGTVTQNILWSTHLQYSNYSRILTLEIRFLYGISSDVISIFLWFFLKIWCMIVLNLDIWKSKQSYRLFWIPSGISYLKAA